MTMDGHSTNLGMCEGLGAQLHAQREIKPYFQLPGSDRKIFLLLDPCHMIKLVRNMLESYGTIKSPDGLIQWYFIRDLNNLQEDLGLRFANKLTARHVKFQDNKMKVYMYFDCSIIGNIIRMRPVV